MNEKDIIFTEPSIGQVEYLRYLQVMSAVQKPSFMTVEIQMFEYSREAVEKTIMFLVRRHESLRTVFPLVDGEIVQAVLPVDDIRLQLEYIEVKDKSLLAEIRKAHFEKAADIFADIQKGPLIKLLMFDTEEGAGIFSFLLHHIICDEWSSNIIRMELYSIYESYLSGVEPALRPLTVQLKDYCNTQNTWLRENKEVLSAFWKGKLRSFDTMFNIYDFRRGYAASIHKPLPDYPDADVLFFSELSGILDRPDAMSYTQVITGLDFQKIRSSAIHEKCTFSSWVYASLFLLHYVYTGKKKLLIPALVSDRLQPEYENLIGCLLGSIYLSFDIHEEQTITDFITAVHRDILTCVQQPIFSHEFLELEGDRIRNCCDMYINYFRKRTDIQFSEYITETHLPVGAIHYPFYCMVIEYNDALVLVWKYNKYLFEDKMIEDLVLRYRQLVKYMTDNTGRKVMDMAGFFNTYALM